MQRNPEWSGAPLPTLALPQEVGQNEAQSMEHLVDRPDRPNHQKLAPSQAPQQYRGGFDPLFMSITELAFNGHNQYVGWWNFCES